MEVGTGRYRYELIENFAKLPEGETFGVISRVTADSRNRLYVFQRKDPAVLVFDRDGKFINSWGSGVFKRAHGFKIVGNLAYVTDGYRNSRVHRFTKDGELIQSWGQPGKTAPGEFHLPHSMAISPEGTLYVSDRANARVQIFAPEGKFIGMWTGMGGANDMARDENGIFYLCEQATPTSKHAISMRDGNGAVLARWETPPTHGMGIDASGNIYAGVTSGGRVNKYVRMH